MERAVQLIINTANLKERSTAIERKEDVHGKKLVDLEEEKNVVLGVLNVLEEIVVKSMKNVNL